MLVCYQVRRLARKRESGLGGAHARFLLRGQKLRGQADACPSLGIKIWVHTGGTSVCSSSLQRNRACALSVPLYVVVMKQITIKIRITTLS